MTKDLTTIRKARQVLSSGKEEEKEKIRQELEALAGSEITDVIAFIDTGQVKLTDSANLSHRARKAIKKIKATPTRYGNAIEVEMHDKLSSLRLLAKHYGMLDNIEDDNRPSVIGINLKGPSVIEVKKKK